MRVRIFGPPGTGKTFTLNKIFGHIAGIEDGSWLLDSIGLNIPFSMANKKDIVFVSFSNTAVDEFVGRLGLRRNYRSGYWSTMHGISMSLLIRADKLDKGIVERTLLRGGPAYWQKKFCLENNIPYDDTGEMNLLGNEFFTALTYVINKYFPDFNSIDRTIDMLEEFNEEFPHMAEDWYKFKKRNGVIDFNDVLILEWREELVPPGRILIADEFQDFSRLQFEIFETWAENMDLVIVAGDDDQAISFHQGAEAKYLLMFDSDRDVVLQQSRRLPKIPMMISLAFIMKYVRNRYRKVFRPRDRLGSFYIAQKDIDWVLNTAEKLAEMGRDVLIMARTNSKVREIEELLLYRGIPYYRFKKHTVWSEFIDPSIKVINAVKSGNLPDVKLLKKYLGMTGLPPERVDTIVVELKKDRLGAFTASLIKKLNTDPAKLLNLKHLAEMTGSFEKARLVIDVLHKAWNNEFTPMRGKIFVETIHSSKGREADYVFIIDSITNRIADELVIMDDGFENEIRVWYVAMTRARHSVVVVPGNIPFLIPRVKGIYRKVMKKIVGS